ncbi:MAG: fumarylacetoacetate hydrolase family protein [Azospirillaceae bacterium]
MKLVSYAIAGGEAFGRLDGDGIVELGTGPQALRRAIAHGMQAFEGPGLATRDPGGVELLPPVPDPGKIVCIGKNYKAHVAEAGHAAPPPFPSLFIRLTNTLVPHGGNLVRPALSDNFDFEGELALIIGRGGRHIAREDALGHIFGYAIFNDASVRDFQFKHSLAAGKNFFASGGFGPAITTADEVADPGRLSLRTRLNGATVQDATTADLIYDIPFIINYVSGFTPLEPGDVIATGTPEGVGFARKPPLWMKHGDTIEVEIETLGTLRNGVIDETSLSQS